MASQPKARATRKRMVSSGPSTSGDNEKLTVTVSLRIPATMLKAIDRAVKARPYKIPRHSWLLEAVHEKLARLRTNEAIRPE